MNLPYPISSTSSLALIGDVGGMELLVIMGAILILFGGKGLPGIARSLGKITRDLQRASEDFKKQLLTADQPDAADTATTAEHPSKVSAATGISRADAQEKTTKGTEPHDTAG